jgi:hypothetical protein
VGHDQQKYQKKPGWIRQSTMVVAAGLTIFTPPVFAQHAAGHVSGGQMTAARPMGSGRPVGTGHPMGAVGSGRTMGGAISNGQRMGGIRPNPFVTGAVPRPTFEQPGTVTPHWELGPNTPIPPNSFQDNHFSRHGAGFGGVGFLGFPYYGDSQAFVGADNGDGTDQQAQPGAPAGPDNGQQAPYAQGGPYDEGYPPPRAPYAPQGYPPPPQNGDPSRGQSAAAQSSAAQSSAEQSDGLDHPEVTLVFNDGRQPMKVHSYVLTGSSVFVAENGHQRVIPVADLDLPATIAQNRDAGVDFELPGGGSR